MKIVETIKEWWAHHKAQQVRNIPDSYLKGYRRLAKSVEETQQPWLNKCSTCRHAVGYVTWHCDRLSEGCKWERCHVATELTDADLRAGQPSIPTRGWIDLPSLEKQKP